MFGLFQLPLVEVSSITKTEPRCISQRRKLYATITEAKTQEALRTRQNLSATAMEVYNCTEEVLTKELHRHYSFIS